MSVPPYSFDLLSYVRARIRVKQSADLDIRLGLVRDLHDELCSGVDHMLENPLVDADREGGGQAVPIILFICHLHGAEVIRVGNEQILLSISDQLIEDTRVQQGVVKISMTRGVPVLLVVIGTMGAWEESLLEDSWISGLVESGDTKLLVGILLDDSEGILMGVERSHEDEGNIHLMGGVQMLDLTDGQVEEGHVVLDL